MDTEIIQSVSTIAFLVIIAFFALVSLMSIYILIRYGQKKSITIMASLAFGAVLFLGALNAFISLQKIF